MSLANSVVQTENVCNTLLTNLRSELSGLENQLSDENQALNDEVASIIESQQAARDDLSTHERTIEELTAALEKAKQDCADCKTRISSFSSVDEIPSVTERRARIENIENQVGVFQARCVDMESFLLTTMVQFNELKYQGTSVSPVSRASPPDENDRIKRHRSDSYTEEKEEEKEEENFETSFEHLVTCDVEDDEVLTAMSRRDILVVDDDEEEEEKEEEEEEKKEEGEHMDEILFDPELDNMEADLPPIDQPPSPKTRDLLRPIAASETRLVETSSSGEDGESMTTQVEYKGNLNKRDELTSVSIHISSISTFDTLAARAKERGIRVVLEQFTKPLYRKALRVYELEALNDDPGEDTIIEQCGFCGNDFHSEIKYVAPFNTVCNQTSCKANGHMAHLACAVFHLEACKVDERFVTVHDRSEENAIRKKRKEERMKKEEKMKKNVK